MNLARRRLLVMAAIAAASPVAWAQTFPKRPILLMVGDSPGGAPDIVARLTGMWLSRRVGQPVVVENRPGAGNTIAMEIVAKSAADGYTLALVGTSAAISASLYQSLDYDLAHDIAPVAGLVRGPLVMVVNPALPTKTIPEFIAYAKANSTKINMASAGTGTGPHVAGELFNMMSGSQMVHVPYHGGPAALTAVLAGQADVYFVAMSSATENIKAGRLRALAVTTAMRWAGMPDVPTIGEFLSGYEASIWFGIGAPKNTSGEVIDKLNEEINASLADPQIKARLETLGSTPMPMTAAEFGRLIADETAKWRKVIKLSGAKVE